MLGDLPGGKDLIDWFGFTPRFHDAELIEIDLSSVRSSTLLIHAWATTDKLDSQGYFITDKHVVVTFTLEQVTHISLSHFHLQGIISDLRITKSGDAYRIIWEGSYGVEGTLCAKQVRIELRPGKPDRSA